MVCLSEKKIGKIITKIHKKTMKNGVVYDIKRYILFGNMLTKIMYVIFLRYLSACLVFSFCVMCTVLPNTNNINNNKEQTDGKKSGLGQE